MNDELRAEIENDETNERVQAYWASPEGVARQLRKFRERYGPHGMACECGGAYSHCVAAPR